MKIPTAWTSNPTKNVNVAQYSSASVLYSSASQDYVSPTVGENEQNKPATAWTQLTKTAVGWAANSLYAINQYPYDSGVFTYDSPTQTYDGINAGQSPIGNKPATAWTAV